MLALIWRVGGPALEVFWTCRLIKCAGWLMVTRQGRAGLDAALVSAAARELREFAKAGLSTNDSAARRMRLLERSPVLAGLTPVRVAGGDSRARAEYLFQATIDAIDAMGRATASLAPAGPLPALSEGAREAAALRELFGLTSPTRARTWRVRQEAAAAALHVSWDYFRHDLQDKLLRSLAEVMLIAAQADHPQSVFDRPAGLWAFATQNDIERDVIEYIRSERPKRATMLEFSTATTGSILRALRDADTSIYLLAANPERVSGWHQSRMRRALTELLHADFAGYDRLSMRLYSVPAALRGRHIGDYVVLGWYTHRDNKRIDAFDPASVEVWGHDNAVVVGRENNSDGAILASWFSREYERLWRHRSTLDEATTSRILSAPY